MKTAKTKSKTVRVNINMRTGKTTIRSGKKTIKTDIAGLGVYSKKLAKEDEAEAKKKPAKIKR